MLASIDLVFNHSEVWAKLWVTCRTSSAICLMALCGRGSTALLCCCSHVSSTDSRLTRLWAASSHILSKRPFRPSLSRTGCQETRSNTSSLYTLLLTTPGERDSWHQPIKIKTVWTLCYSSLVWPSTVKTEDNIFGHFPIIFIL